MHGSGLVSINTYRVKDGAQSAFKELLLRHWPALRDAGLATDTPAQIYEADNSRDNRHNEKGATFLEIFTWSSAEAPRIAHETPEIMAVWEPMGGLVETRDGRPGMEFPNYRQVEFGA